jgi:hypothetical protein
MAERFVSVTTKLVGTEARARPGGRIHPLKQTNSPDRINPAPLSWLSKLPIDIFMKLERNLHFKRISGLRLENWAQEER